MFLNLAKNSQNVIGYIALRLRRLFLEGGAATAGALARCFEKSQDVSESESRAL